MRINAGALDRSMSIYAVTRTAVNGQNVETETLIATVASQRLELRTIDVTRMAGQLAQQSGRYLLRYRAGLTNKHRVTVDGIHYKITAIDEPDRRTTLILTVEAL